MVNAMAMVGLTMGAVIGTALITLYLHINERKDHEDKMG